MATSEPEAATALGSYDGFCSKTLWFDRNASTLPISTMKTVESPPTARVLGWEAVEAEAGLRENVLRSALDNVDAQNTHKKLDPSASISLTLSSNPTEYTFASETDAAKPETLFEWFSPRRVVDSSVEVE